MSGTVDGAVGPPYEASDHAEGASGSAPEVGEAPDWQHLHPLSPVLRGGLAFVAVMAYVVSQQADRLVGAAGDDPTGGHLGWAAVGVLVVLLAIVGGAWLSWRFSRYRVTANLIELRTGFVFRQHRQVRFDRVQAVDVGRPLLARLTGLSEVIVRSAGGRDSHLTLAFLSDARAQEVREQLVALAAREDAPTGPTWQGSLPAGPAGPATDVMPSGGARVVSVPNSRVVQSILYTGQSALLVLAVPALVGSVIGGIPGMLAWLGPTALAIGGAQAKRLTHETNFELLHQGDRLRVRHGLTDLRTTTVPLHRIQAVEVSQSLPWRLTGWWRLRVNVAGAGHGDDEADTVLLPVGTLDEALAVLALVQPGAAPSVAVAALTGEGTEQGFTTATRRARLLDPLSWRRRGYAVLPELLVTRRGLLYRSAQFVPHARVQSLAVTQGPLERAAGVATVRLVSTPGPVKPLVAHLDTGDAERLLTEQDVRSRHARGVVHGPGDRLAERPHRG
ncbi:PH domain-containing protein [Pedococcus ginsenosidimutans]|uniref:PH domain-containing protein n=1 Tax=Pedococcus ginsenosidimutans TaxID=490570 RepID=A0ABP8YB86_9MICO